MIIEFHLILLLFRHFYPMWFPLPGISRNADRCCWLMASVSADGWCAKASFTNSVAARCVLLLIWLTTAISHVVTNFNDIDELTSIRSEIQLIARRIRPMWLQMRQQKWPQKWKCWNEYMYATVLERRTLCWPFHYFYRSIFPSFSTRTEKNNTRKRDHSRTEWTRERLMIGYLLISF